MMPETDDAQLLGLTPKSCFAVNAWGQDEAPEKRDKPNAFARYSNLLVFEQALWKKMESSFSKEDLVKIQFRQMLQHLVLLSSCFSV